MDWFFVKLLTIHTYVVIHIYPIWLLAKTNK